MTAAVVAAAAWQARLATGNAACGPETDVTMHVDGAALRTLRERRGWPQQHRSEVAGVSVRTVRRLESGGPATGEIRMGLAAALDIRPEALAAVATAAVVPAPATRAGRMDPDRALKLIWTVLAVIGFLLVAGCQVGKDAAIRDDRISARGAAAAE